MATRTFARNGKDNAFARHDLGLALGQMGVQATALGLGMHLMAVSMPVGPGRLWDFPEELDLVAVAAIGALPVSPGGEMENRAGCPRRWWKKSWPHASGHRSPHLSYTDVRPGTEQPDSSTWGLEDAQKVLDFWFGALDGEGLAAADFTKRWFVKDPAFDEELRALLGPPRRGHAR